jgi:hypothetical protein
MFKEKFHMEDNCPGTIENLVNPYRIHFNASVDSVILLSRGQYSFQIRYSAYLLLNFGENF